MTSLSDRAAKALSNFKGEVLCLNGLTSLNDATAQALSNLTGALYLTGLTSLDDAASEALSNFKGRRLHLDGLTSLSNSAAKTVLKLSGRVSCSSIDPSEFYLSMLGATASNYYDLKISPNSGTVRNPG